MKKKDIIPAIIWLVLGIVVAVISYKYKLGSLKNPGPGLMPFLLAVGLSICSIVIIVRSYLAFKRREGQGQEGLWSGIALKKLILVVGSLLVYIVFLQKIGFVFATFPLLLILFKIIGSRKWHWALVASVSTVLISYFLFVVLLKVELPMGLWR